MAKQRTGEWRQVWQLLMDAVLREAMKLKSMFLSFTYASSIPGLVSQQNLPAITLQSLVNSRVFGESLVYVDFKFN